MDRTSNTRFVLVTGASTGIGRACARELDQRGFTVFAGVRRTQDGDALRANASDRLTPIRLDVAKDEDVAAAADTLGAACGEAGLHALINNAGIALGGPLETVDMTEFRQQLDVNVSGLVAVTRACIPLLRQAKHSTIVNMGSVSGVATIPFVGPYAASKHAVEAISDSLRVELRPWGIRVVLFQPGVVKTPIWDKSREDAARRRAAMGDEANRCYGTALDRMMHELDHVEKRGITPEALARHVADAIEAARPKTRYLLGGGARAQAFLGRHIPDRLRDWLFAKMLGHG
jgi:NAD(P)-dependent dehydrogenase (short-subunit alcohol dehydrogenase family)